ncbi:MAG: 4Fe-4S dicluster domain-containing protein [Spirochaetaceae bacterium]|nr:MAG: 4Fe-4S dicluster domain-containing protein [Spirochaetaceae bacterium]
MKENIEAEKIVVDELDRGFCNEVAALPGGQNIRKCFACGTCAAGCPVTGIDEQYNSRKIIRQVLFGMREEVLSSPLIWFCLMCYRCYARCPQQVNFPDVMKALRYLAIKHGHASADLLGDSDEVDRMAQTIRRDMIKNTVEGRKQVIEELKARIAPPSLLK